ncbi:MAG TPA: cysteine desulfurase-like protein [Solirubrobacteraceae bacterium]|jgi:cysteine desulfurase family protein (TIGR01976 family)|nr:cysteine desulfurase-like protein [Solirubrobacteraceae bacterium]
MSALNRSIEDIRAEFPGLSDGWASLDGAAGTQVPTAVIDAIAAALRDGMANLHGPFAASERSTAIVWEARRAVADLVNGTPEGVVLGPNMTTLTFHIADALSTEWSEGDEIVVTSLDHDANIRPWVIAAGRAGATVRWAEFDPETGELPPQRFDELIGDRTRLVAVTAASNAIGSRPDVRAIADRAHAAGARVYVDGVHATPHVPTDMRALGADFYIFSTYKLFGPHAGALVADPALLERVTPAKLAPADDNVPDRFERGTPAFELLAGVTAAVDWLAGLSDAPGARRDRIVVALAAVEAYLAELLRQTLDGLAAIDGVRVLPAPARRTSTLSFVVDGHTPLAVAEHLAARRVSVWNGDNYAYELMGRFGLQDAGGAVRASLVLYNTAADVDRLLEALAELT